MFRNRVFLRHALLVCVLAQVACAPQPKKQEPPPAPPPEPVKLDPAEERRLRIAAENLNPRQRLTRALELFQAGQPEDAREHLVIALEEKPRYRLARNALEQFDADPQAMLGRQYFRYRVQPGESLSLIAERFLGDKLKFIILARYNGLAEPARLEAGQVLRIPERYKPKPRSSKPVASAPPPVKPEAEPQMDPESVSETETETETETEPRPVADSETQTEPAPVADTQPQPESAPAEETVPPSIPETVSEPPVEPAPEPQPSAYDSVAEAYRQGDHEKAIELAEQAVETEQDPRLAALLADAYGARAQRQIAAEQWQGARDSLSRASDLAPGNRDILDSLTLVEDKIEAARLFAIGKAQLSQGELNKAHQSFKDATVFDPNNTAYSDARADLGRKLEERYHRSAMEHYHRERLDEAKADWLKVLEINPNNRIAPGYLAKVEEIQKRLREVEGQ